MINLDAEVRAALLAETLALLGGEKVYQPNQPVDGEQFPAIVFEEISNVPAAIADNKEAAARITYRLLVYSKTNVAGLVDAAERAMLEAGFSRHSAANIHDLPVGMRGKEILFVTIRGT